jgi:hypothetical protein
VGSNEAGYGGPFTEKTARSRLPCPFILSPRSMQSETDEANTRGGPSRNSFQVRVSPYTAERRSGPIVYFISRMCLVASYCKSVRTTSELSFLRTRRQQHNLLVPHICKRHLGQSLTHPHVLCVSHACCAFQCLLFLVVFP